jgi:hypothetical protein
VERDGAGEGGLGEQVVLAGDVRVDGGLLDAQRAREVADRGAVVAARGEHPRGLQGQALARGHARSSRLWPRNSATSVPSAGRVTETS